MEVIPLPSDAEQFNSNRVVVDDDDDDSDDSNDSDGSNDSDDDDHHEHDQEYYGRKDYGNSDTEDEDDQ